MCLANHSRGNNPTPAPAQSNGVNGAEPLPKKVAEAPKAEEAPKAAETPKATEDTSWFKRSCKDVAPLKKSDKPGDAAQLDQRGLHKQLSGDKYSAVFINSDQLWNSTPQILNYCFIGTDFIATDAHREKVRTAVEEWTWYANVEFKEVKYATESDIRIQLDPNDGSWSYVGQQSEKIPVTEPTMNLAWLDKSSPSLTANERAVILHEFGHVLGLLHEHQSPAHGGSAVSNIQAAIDLYTNTQGWSIQDVYHQVINVYNQSDVSSFSQVDTSSIMHYPQPKQITGLAEDIPYNTKLTDLDKAYVILMYPRKELDLRAKADGWSFERALDVMGAPDDVKIRVLRLLQSDRDSSTGQISPVNIRREIEDWTRAAHSKNGASTSPASSVNPVQTIANVKQYGQVTAATENGQDLCSAEVATSTDNGMPAHAVTTENSLWPLPNDGDFKALTITYTIRAVNEKNETEKVTADQESLVKESMRAWSAVATVSFVAVQSDTPVDLVIQFNNTATVLPEGKLRSSCGMPSGEAKIARRKDNGRKRNRESLSADIIYNGIFPVTTKATEYKSKSFKSKTGDPVDGAALNFRSVVHELGHWLGLHHEYVGLYGFMMHDPTLVPSPTLFKEEIASKLYATRYDAGSVMDAIGMRLTDEALDILKEKGLQPASVTTLQDKTKSKVLSRVDISLGLSRYDEANIALLYPGSNLVDEVTPGTFSLKKSQNPSDQSLLETYLKSLKLYSTENIEKIAPNLKAGKWQVARKVYLALLSEAQTKEADSRKKFLNVFAKQLNVEGTSIKGVFDVSLTSDTSGPAHGIINPPLHDADPGTGGGGSNGREIGTPILRGQGSFIWELYHKLSQLYCMYWCISWRELADNCSQAPVVGNISRCNSLPGSSISRPMLINSMATSRASTSLL